MEPAELQRRSEVGEGPARYVIELRREDFSAVYPGMNRYVLTVTAGDRPVARFVTNNYEYSPRVPLEAECVALELFSDWERRLREDPAGFIADQKPEPPRPVPSGHTDLVFVQGSPRGDGNCSILAEWAADAARNTGRTAQVIYPHDLDIRCCIGCYQCYNTGHCVFDDDMAGIIDAIRGAAVVIVCSPVYTNTVPGGLKLMIDRFQAYHAERVLVGKKTGQTGLVFGVAGRKGEDNFTCVRLVLSAFLRNIGIRPSGEILIDGIDAVRDIRTLPGMEEKVRALVQQALAGH